MKTLFFCNLIPLKSGAFEALLAAIGVEFRKAGDEFVVVFAGEPVEPVAAALREAGVRWRLIEGWSEGHGREHAWHFVRPALALLRQERPDVAVVHFGNEFPTLAVSLLARLTLSPRPRWVWQQDQQIRDPGAVGRRLSRIRSLLLGVDRYVAVYDGGRRSLLKRGIPDGRISVIYNSIAPHAPLRSRGWLRAELGLAPQATLIVSTGSLIPRKRQDFVLRACARLKDRSVTDWRLLVIGDGPERQPLLALADQLGLKGRVHFLGLRSDVREILAEADVLVHASLAETCTYAITESMAAGIPAVVTEAGASREQIVSGITGHVLAAEDIEGFAARLAELVDDGASRLAMGQAAKQRWMERYRLEVAAGQYWTLYASLCRPGATSGDSATASSQGRRVP